MKTIIAVIALIAALGIVGEMDYADACKHDKHCHYEGWAK